MEPVEIVVIVVVVLVGFFVKGVTGIGAPLLIIPVLAGFTGLEFAVTVIAIPTFLSNTFLLWQTRSATRQVIGLLWPLLVTGAVGTGFGSWLLVSFDSRVMTITLAVLIIGYVVWSLCRRDFRLGERWAKRLSAPVGLLGGILQGGTGASGPVVATYIHSLKLDRAGFIQAVNIPFQVLSAVQIASLFLLGGYDRERLLAAAIATAPALLALGPAMRVGHRLSARTFQGLVLVVLTVAALRLMWTVATGS